MIEQETRTYQLDFESSRDLWNVIVDALGEHLVTSTTLHFEIEQPATITLTRYVDKEAIEQIRGNISSDTIKRFERVEQTA